jgi:hypothetical protein
MGEPITKRRLPINLSLVKLTLLNPRTHRSLRNLTTIRPNRKLPPPTRQLNHPSSQQRLGLSCRDQTPLWMDIIATRQRANPIVDIFQLETWDLPHKLFKSCVQCINWDRATCDCWELGGIEREPGSFEDGHLNLAQFGDNTR